LLQDGIAVQAAVIINRQAGSLRRDPELAEHLHTHSRSQVQLYSTADQRELAAAAEAVAQSGVTTVGIVGGDGSISYALTALARAYGDTQLPRIALLRGGTMNTIAAALGIRNGRPSALLAEMLDAVYNQERPATRVRPCMRVGDQLGFLFGTGVWYGYLAEAYADGHPTRLTNAAVLARLFASAAVGGTMYRRVRARQRVVLRSSEGAWEAREYLTIAAGTVRDAGFGFRPFQHAFEHDDRFELLAVKAGPWSVLRDLPGLRFGRSLRPSTAHDTCARWAELSSEDGRPFGYSVDGEIATAEGCLRITLGPPVTFLCL
jgi:diacylglycerol kinase family enzyme